MSDEITSKFKFNYIPNSDVINRLIGDDDVTIVASHIIEYVVGKYDIKTEVIITNEEIEGCLVYLGCCDFGRIYAKIPTNHYTVFEYHLSRNEHNNMVEFYHNGAWKRVVTSCMTLDNCFGGMLKPYYQKLRESVCISK